jgi:DNA ligase-1
MFKPMLAASLPVDVDLATLAYPVLASRKLDGVRATIQDGVVMSRNLKPIPNKYVQRLFGRAELNGLDGELIMGDPCAPDCFRATSSAVMSVEGEPEVTFWVFDYFDLQQGFDERLRRATAIVNKTYKKLPCWKRGKRAVSCLRLVEQESIETPTELADIEAMYLAEGCEGVMLRKVDGRYKQGRSTLREWWLVKLKRFKDGEAVVTGYEELMSNQNAATVDALGHKKRSSHKAGKVPMGMLGAFHVRDLKTKIEFSIGAGFTTELRALIWRQPKLYVGAIVKYKYFPSGSKDKPRFPVFLGFRDKRDM